MARPRLELLVAPGTGERVIPLVRVLGRWFEPTAPDRSLALPVVTLATSPGAPGLAERLASDIPTFVWCDPSVESVEGLDPSPTAVLQPTATPVAPADGIIPVPHPGVDGGDHRPVSPFVRERWRRRYVLPPELVVSAGLPGAPDLSDDELGTGLAVAAAVAVSGPVVLRAMALGAPTATDPETAERFGLGEGVVVADHPVAAAEELATDSIRAAALSLRARQEVESHHDLVAPARHIRSCVAPSRFPGSSNARTWWERLEELGTPRHSLPARRAGAAVADLPGALMGG